MSFTKLDRGIVNSTLWVMPDDVLRVWIWLLSQSDANGMVRVAAPALAMNCMKSVDRIREIMTILESPDPDSRSENDEGRRLRKVPGGWQIINYRAYRDARDPEATLARKREWDRQNRPSGHARQADGDDADSPTQSDTVRRSPTQSDQSDKVRRSPTQAEAEAEADIEAEDQKQKHVQPAAARCRFGEFWSAYPNKKGKQEAEKTWRKRKLDDRCDELVSHVRLMQAKDDDWVRGYVPMGSTYLNQARWEDVPKLPTSAAKSAEPSKTMTAIQRLQGMKSDAMGTRRDSGRAVEAALPWSGQDAGQRHDRGHGDGLD